MVIRTPPEGLYTSLVEGNVKVLNEILIEVVTSIAKNYKRETEEGRVVGIDCENNLKKEFQNNTMIKTAMKCSSSRDVIKEAEDQLLEMHDEINIQKLHSWRKTTEKALTQIQPLLNELLFLENELRSLQKTKNKKQTKTIFSAAKRGLKKGIKRGTKLFKSSKGKTSSSVSIPKSGIKTAMKGPPAVKGSVLRNKNTSVTRISNSNNHMQVVTSAGLSAGLFGGVASLRKSIRNSENSKIETGKQNNNSVDTIIVPAIQDAAIAAGTAGGTAFAVSQAAESSALVTIVTPGITTGVFTLIGVGSAVSAWSSGSMTQREFQKTLAKISMNTTITAVSVASLVTAPATGAAVGFGSVLLEVFGLTDHFSTLLFGRDRRSLRVELITSYASALNVLPQSTNEAARVSFNELAYLTSRYGTAEDIHILEYCCSQFLVLRDDQSTTQETLSAESVTNLDMRPTNKSSHDWSSWLSKTADSSNSSVRADVTEREPSEVVSHIDVSQMRPITKSTTGWNWFSKTTPILNSNKPDDDNDELASDGFIEKDESDADSDQLTDTQLADESDNKRSSCDDVSDKSTLSWSNWFSTRSNPAVDNNEVKVSTSLSSNGWKWFSKSTETISTEGTQTVDNLLTSGSPVDSDEKTIDKNTESNNNWSWFSRNKLQTEHLNDEDEQPENTTSSWKWPSVPLPLRNGTPRQQPLELGVNFVEGSVDSITK